ncbi:MAG: response regulator transcription factor [Candidatus Brocadiia bacterium]|nr:MAG: response regulator transcription factor [Candidatus Brocadiia bacterium]
METKVHILVVEDEDKIREALGDFLDYHGYTVTMVADGLEAERAVEGKHFDLILLDLMLPKISGEQLCSKWRQEDLQTPIIMLTAKGLEKEKVTGLNLGADDYITKPFSLEELLARINAVLRRTVPVRAVGKKFQFGDLEIDISGLKANRCGKPIDISKREAQLIQFFAANPNRVIAREELYEKVWGEPMSEFGTRTTDMHIAKLRGKIEKKAAEPQLIKTVRGAGYIYQV